MAGKFLYIFKVRGQSKILHPEGNGKIFIKMKFVKPVGPKFDGESIGAWTKVLDYTSQVWINCEDQVNMYAGDPCGSLFAGVAGGFKDCKAISRDSNTINHPVSIFYSLALEFGKHIDNQECGSVASLMSIILIKWAEFLEGNNSVSFNHLIDGFYESLNFVENLKYSHPMIQCLQSGKESVMKIRNKADIVMYLQEAASVTEQFASKSESSSGAHLIGITLRAIYQALQISLR